MVQILSRHKVRLFRPHVNRIQVVSQDWRRASIWREAVVPATICVLIPVQRLTVNAAFAV
jgi:hypothetical protein